MYDISDIFYNWYFTKPQFPLSYTSNLQVFDVIVYMLECNTYEHASISLVFTVEVRTLFGFIQLIADFNFEILRAISS